MAVQPASDAGLALDPTPQQLTSLSDLASVATFVGLSNVGPRAPRDTLYELLGDRGSTSASAIAIFLAPRAGRLSQIPPCRSANPLLAHPPCF